MSEDAPTAPDPAAAEEEKAGSKGAPSMHGTGGRTPEPAPGGRSVGASGVGAGSG
ncbi:hypothetical protein [Kitasatospora sp. NRRL B-11411]|uniref:hypothetical protein n=1 Tax=Kitasatospora sp. NRRL B-11411 TaxID=1463822 RepID=UPI000AE2D1E8|nr:hypothetical protein [Kitasatospora sp. NRRL B-11411]